MAYTPTNWQDLPDTSTPIAASRLNNMEAGIVAAYVPGAGGLANVDIAAGAGIAISKLASYPADSSKVLYGNGSWNNISSETNFASGTTNSAAISATTEGTAVTLASCNTITYDGATKLYIRFFMPGYASASSPVITLVFARNTSGGILDLIIGHVIVPTATAGGAFYASVFDTPSLGPHNYYVAAYVSTGSFTLHAGAGGAGNLAPAWMSVSKA